MARFVQWILLLQCFVFCLATVPNSLPSFG